MHQETILLLDGDAAARGEHLQRIQEAGYLVQESLSDPAGGIGIEHPPELVVASMPLSDEHREQLKRLSHIERRPFFLFLLSENRAQDGKEAIELGADDLLKRPFTSNDLQTRLQLLAERRRRENLGRPGESSTGQVKDVSVRDMISLFAAGKGTATVQINADKHRGKLFFKEGQLCAVSLDHRHGLNALTRLMRLKEGDFALTPSIDESDLPGPIEHPEPLQAAQDAIDKWEGLLRKLPPTSHSIQVDFQQVQQHLDELNDLAEQLLWQLASHRSLEGVIDDLDGDLVEALTELYNLYEKGFFSTRSEQSSSMFSETHTASIEGIESSIALRSHRGGGFNEGLANAAKEAALQLMAAAQPVSNPHLEVHPDQFPSFAEMAAEGFSQDALSSLSRRGKETNSHARLEPALFPIEEINDERAGSFALDDFKNLSTEPPSFDTTVPSVEAANPEDFEDLELPIKLNDDDGTAPKALPTGDFSFSVGEKEQPPLFAPQETAPLSEKDEEEGVRQMLKLETMDVLDRLLQNELSSIEIDGVHTSDQVDQAEEDEIPLTPIDKPISLNSTMPLGIDVTSNAPVMAPPEPIQEAVVEEPVEEPVVQPAPQAPSRIQLQIIERK